MLPSFDIHHALFVSFSLLTLPWQALKTYVVDRCSAARFFEKSHTRSEFSGPHLMDHLTLRDSLKMTPAEDYRLLVSILGLGRWTETYAGNFDTTLEARGPGVPPHPPDTRAQASAVH